MSEFIEVTSETLKNADLSEKVKKQIENLGAGKIVKRGADYTTIAVMVKDEGEKVLKIFEVLTEFIPKVIEPAAQFWEDLKAAFAVLPQRIDMEIGNPKSFVLTVQEAAGKAEDRVLYLYLDEEKNTYLTFAEAEAPTLFKAKRLMYEKLQARGVV